MSTSLEQKWQSGGWRDKPSSKIPYNEVEITALPAYDDNGKLISVAVTFSDYTNDPNGVTSSLPELLSSEGKVTIPVATTQSDPTTDSPPSDSPPASSPPDSTPDDRFTIDGWVALEPQLTQVYLRVHFSFGVQPNPHEELGYILGFDARIDVSSASPPTS